MEFVLIAWFSLFDFDDTALTSDALYGYGFATSISQEFNSREACESAGKTLQKTKVNTDSQRNNSRAARPSWNWV